MKWLGLTGGIGSGKSSVAQILKDLGFPVIDADALARQVVERGTPALDQVAKAFGQQVLNANGELDRQALGRVVFGDENKLGKLEAILHPQIRELKTKERLRLEREGATAAFYDVPLLFEKNLQDEFDATFLVYCKPEQQLERVMTRDGLSKAEVQSRMGKQIPLEKKKSLADFVIPNIADKTELAHQVKVLLKDLKLL